MALLKRFELWLLLILIGSGLFYVFNIEAPDDEYGREPISPEPSQIAKSEPPPRFSLNKTTITRDGDHFLAEIEIHIRNEHKQPLEHNPPNIRLWAAGGNEVPEFFLPFQSPVKTLEPGETNTTLRFWLTLDDINGSVSLQINNDTIPVKTGDFKADVLPDKQSRSFTGTNWSPKA